MEHLQSAVVDCSPKVVGWEQRVGFYGLGMIDCWLCWTSQKVEEWAQGVADFGPYVVDFWPVVGKWAQAVVQLCVALQNLGG